MVIIKVRNVALIMEFVGGRGCFVLISSTISNSRERCVPSYKNLERRRECQCLIWYCSMTSVNREVKGTCEYLGKALVNQYDMLIFNETKSM